MTVSRNYRCKNEEVIVICEYSHNSLLRDLSDFQAYSPKFNAAYVTGYKTNINAAHAMLRAGIETQELKVVTARLYATMDSLIPALDRLEGYISLAGSSLPIAAKDFKTPALKQKIRSRDAEGTLENLQLLAANIEKYNTQLTEQGLSTQDISLFAGAHTSITADNNKQYKIVSSRRELSQDNQTQLNNLYAQFTEISKVGKIIYAKTNAAKAKDYTFAELKKKVRIDG